jgi:hypothetical protein
VQDSYKTAKSQLAAFNTAWTGWHERWIGSDLGTVSGLTIHDSEQAFLSAAQQGSGAAVAAGLATIGLAGAAADAGLAATSTGDPVQFFTCQLGERTVAGGFSKVTFKDGEEVSFVVVRQSPAADWALAAIRPRDHTLWMSLRCSRGLRAHRRFRKRTGGG